MKKKIFMVLSVLPWLLLGAALVWFLFSYSSLPERIGVHFGPDGDFDVIAEKVFGFYPFAAGTILMILFSVVGHFAGKIKNTGAKITSEGDKVLRSLIRGFVCFLCWVWSVFFTRWTYSVITQTPNNLVFLQIISAAFFFSIPAFIAAFIFIRIKYRKRKNTDIS